MLQLSKKSAISAVEISESPVRNEQILPNFHFILPKFHFILPNFYFAPPWGIFVFHVEISDFLGRRVTVVGALGRASVPVKTTTLYRFDTTDALRLDTIRASLRRATRLLWLSDLQSYPSQVSLVGIVLISL